MPLDQAGGYTTPAPGAVSTSAAAPGAVNPWAATVATTTQPLPWWWGGSTTTMPWPWGGSTTALPVTTKPAPNQTEHKASNVSNQTQLNPLTRTARKDTRPNASNSRQKESNTLNRTAG